MKLTVEKARELIQKNPAGKIPKSKVDHCLEVGRIARKIAQKCGLDLELAEILGIIHDIGYMWNSGYQHSFVGYKYLKSLGYDDEYANICLTHSFIHGDPNCTADGLHVKNGKVLKNRTIPYENEEDSKFFLNFLKTHKYTKIEDIINLCDLMVSDKVIGLDKRLIDFIVSSGAHSTTRNHIITARELQAQLENEMGCSMLDLFPEIFENQKSDDTYNLIKNSDEKKKNDNFIKQKFSPKKAQPKA